jgi:hypothetical protein
MLLLRSSSVTSHVHTRTHTHTTHTHTLTHSLTHTRACARARAHTHTHMQSEPEVRSVGHAEGARYAFLCYANQSASKVDTRNLLPLVTQHKLSLVP